MVAQTLGFVAAVNDALLAPFRRPRPIEPIALAFVLLLVLAVEWHLILDRIEA